MSNGDAQKIDFTVGDRAMAENTKNRVEAVHEKLEDVEGLLKEYIRRHEELHEDHDKKFNILRDEVKTNSAFRFLLGKTIKIISTIVGVLGVLTGIAAATGLL